MVWILLTGVAVVAGPIRAQARAVTPARAPAAPDPLDVALDDIYDLKFDAAREITRAWLREHPADLRALSYLANVTLDQELLKRGLFATEPYASDGEAFRKGRVPLSPGFDREFLGILQKTQKLAEDRLKQNPNDQEALYWAGTAHGTRSEFHFALERSYLVAIREGAEARRYNLKLHKLNPHCVDALFVLGIADYIGGSLPWYLKLPASIAGVRGSRTRGLDELRRVGDEGHWARVDAKIVLVTIYRREKMYPQALSLLQELARAYPRNFLAPVEMAALYELQNDWQSATKVHDALVQRLGAHEPGWEMMPAARIFYRAGRAHERLGQLDEALELYETASRVPRPSRDTYRAGLAAAELDRRLNRREEALRNYQRVARAVPNTDEGRAALRALQSFR